MLDVFPTPLDKIAIGDVIVFRQYSTATLIVHRVVGIKPSGLITQGDHSIEVDLPIVKPEYIVGVVRSFHRRGELFKVGSGRFRIIYLRAGKKFRQSLRWLARPIITFALLLFSRLGSTLLKKRITIVTFSEKTEIHLNTPFGARTIGKYNHTQEAWSIEPRFKKIVENSHVLDEIASN